MMKDLSNKHDLNQPIVGCFIPSKIFKPLLYNVDTSLMG